MNKVQSLAEAIRTVGGTPSPAAQRVLPAMVDKDSNGKQQIWATKESKATLALAIAMESHIYLYGPTGVGKSTTARALLESKGTPYYRFQGYEGFSSDDWYGTATLDEKGAIQISYSSMVKAVEEGCPVIVEELNLIQPTQMGPLFSFLDDTPWVDVTIVGRTKRIPKKKGFMMIATANDNGSGDMLHIYGGGQLLNRAIASRFGAFVHTSYLPSDMEIDMVQTMSGLKNKTLLQKMQQVVYETRKIAVNEPAKIEGAISPRNFIEWAKAYLINDQAKAGLDHEQIAGIVLINRLSEGLQETLKTLVKNSMTGAPLSDLHK